MAEVGLDLRVVICAIFAATGAMGVLLLEVFLSRRGSAGKGLLSEERVGSVLAAIASLALILAILASWSFFASGIEASFDPDHPMLRLDSLSSFATAVVALSALLSVLLSVTYLAALHIDHGEYYALLLLSTAGAFLLVSAVDLMSVFVGLELMSVPLYALAGFDRRKLRSNEAALKLFLMGAFASGIYLYGAALLYGATGGLDFVSLRDGLDAGSPMAVAGIGLVVVGFACKVAAVPFHQWAPDVYEGAPTSVTAFLSVTEKLAVFFVLLRVSSVCLAGDSGGGERVLGVFWALSALTMIVGNVMALVQRNVKRMLAYSAIAHSGYLLLALATATPEAYGALLFYLVTYLFLMLGAFAVVVALAQGGRECERIEEYEGLAQRRPGLAAAMTLFMLGLVGMPGTAGFIAKFELFNAGVQGGLVGLVALAAIMSVVSAFYYVRIPTVMYMRRHAEAGAAQLSLTELLVLAICAGAVLYLGIFPSADPLSLEVLELVRSTVGD
ncbi:MAG: NADH-quinone oxidoreductase subunit N [Deltaproteobacteria bacterium]|nr:NADH-quinone oxidoreductase subunit N [Deltaproteobacteria bacterium]